MAVNQLVPSDRHYWQPVPQVVQYLCDTIPAKAEVLEIGPGHVPFPRATVFVDFMERLVSDGKKLLRINGSDDLLPFNDKSFDFVYCRHVLEDMYNPFLLLQEMSRVAQSGYIECPSPIAEMGRGVDGGSPGYRGYRHHHFIVWSYQNKLRFLAKYPIVEYIKGDERDDECLALLRQGPAYWNTYYLWNGTIAYQHRQNGPDYDIDRDYGMMLADAIKQSKNDTDEFWLNIPDKVEIPTLQRAFG